MIEESVTPRTDELQDRLDAGVESANDAARIHNDLWDLARQLERELAEYRSRAELAEIAQVEASHSNDETPDNVGDSDRWQDPRDLSGGATDCEVILDGRVKAFIDGYKASGKFDPLDAYEKAIAYQGTLSVDEPRTTKELRELFDKVAEKSLGDYPWKVETGLMAVYELGRHDAKDDAHD